MCLNSAGIWKAKDDSMHLSRSTCCRLVSRGNVGNDALPEASACARELGSIPFLAGSFLKPGSPLYTGGVYAMNMATLT